MGIEWIKTIMTSVTIFFASIVHGVAGFGLAQLGMGILPLFRTAASSAIIFSMVSIVSNFVVWWSVREEFDVKEWLKPVIGLIVGMPLGLYIFNGMNEAQVKTTIGIVLVVAVIFIVLGKQTDIMANVFKDKKYRPKWALPIAVGFVAGVLGGAVAIPGPPMILYGTFMTSAGLWTNKQMKAIFTGFFGILMVYRVLSTAIQGSITMGLTIEALIAIPALLLGTKLGIMIFDKISSKVFNWIVIAMLALNAVILLI